MMIYIFILALISIPAHCLVRHDSIPRGGHIVSLESIPRFQSIQKNETIQFPISTSYGEFHIHLSPHNELFDAGASSTNFFKGHVAGFENESTARFHVVGQHIEGIFSVLENGKDKFFFVDGIENRLGQVLQLVIYDQLSHHQDTHCGCNSTMSNGTLISPSRRLRRRQVVGKRPQAVGKTCRVALIADASFSSQHGAKTRDYMLQTMNTVSGIYERTFQLKLEVKQINDAGRVNYGGGSAQSLASFVEDVRRGSFGFNSRDFCVVHMFVSQSNWGSTAGIAMVGTVCRDSNVGITTDRIGNRLQNGQSLAITVAHEIGHNFGANHSPDRNSIMSATVFDGATQFSSGSIEQISSSLGAGCLMASGGGGSSSQPPPQTNFPESGPPFVPSPPQIPERQFPIVPSLPEGRPNSPISVFPNLPQTPDRPVSNNPNIPNGPTCLRRPGSPSVQPQPQRQPSPDVPKKELPKNNIGSPVRRPNNPISPNRTVNNPNAPTRRPNGTGQIIPSPNPATSNRSIQNPPKVTVPNPNFPIRPPTAGRAGPGSPANAVQRPVPGSNNNVPNRQSNPNPYGGLPVGLNRPQIPRPNSHIAASLNRVRPSTNARSAPLLALASHSYTPHTVPRHQPSNDDLAKTFEQEISGRGRRDNIQPDEAMISLHIEGDMAYF